MKAVILMAALGFVSFVGTAKILGSSPFPGVRLLVRTGVLFMLLGAVVGPNGADLFDQTSFHKLGPLIVIGLGWLGFFFGTNLEARTLRKFPLSLYVSALTQSVVTFFVVFGATLLIAGHYMPLTKNIWIAATVLGATASGTAPSSLFMLGADRLARGARYETLSFFATVDDIPGLLALGILSAFAPGMNGAAIKSPVMWFAMQLVLGVVFGVLLGALKLQTLDEAAGDLVVFGVIGMLSGMCLYLHLSPLFVSALTGMVVVNISDRSEGIYERVSRREHTFYVLFLLLSGCFWNLASIPLINLVYLTGAYVLLRAVGKVVGALCSRQTLPEHLKIPATSGLALLSQGGLAVAMVVNYRWAYAATLENWVVSVVLLAVVIHELITPWLEVTVLRGVGEA